MEIRPQSATHATHTVVRNATHNTQWINKMYVNLECEICGWIFSTELGKLEMDKTATLIYEHKPVCPRCHTIDKVFITRQGFNELNEWFQDYLTRYRP